MEGKLTVRQAAEAVLSRCDGAVKRDNVGYNGMDSSFVRSVLEQPHQMSRRQEQTIYKLLRKYRKQLQALGIDYDQIQDPGSQPEPVEAMKLEYRKVTVGGRERQRLALFTHRSFRDQAKEIHGGRWDPELKAWLYYPCLEVLEGLAPHMAERTIRPTASALRVLDKLGQGAQQRLQVQQIKEGNGTRHQLPVKTKPYKHQDEAFQIGVAADQTALLMEQGTGKTLSAIAVAGHRYQAGQIRKLLVVAPLSVISVWEDEFRKHAQFDHQLVSIASTKENKRKEKLDSLRGVDGLQVLVINYEATWRCIDLLTKWQPDMVVADESQKIKNGRAKQSKAVHKLGDQASYKLVLTGTPITQGPLDVWSQYRFLNPDIFGRRYLSFRDRYATMGGYGGYQVVGYRNLEELAKKAHSIAYRVTKAEALDLPDTIDQEIRVTLAPETRKLYQQMEEEFLVQFSDTEIAKAPIILTQLLRLQQITGGFLPVENGQVKEFDSAKLDALKELLQDLPENKKVVIFARFLSEIKAIKKVSEELGRNPEELTGSTGNRGWHIRRFQEMLSVKDIVVQTQTGGLGITLTAADTAVFYSTTFSYADYDQAKARFHRINQKNTVTYIHILAGGTIDEQVLEILKTKGDMATEIVDRMKGGPKLIGLENRLKGGWTWDETTGKIIRRRADDGEIEYLDTKSTLEEARERIKDLPGVKLAKLSGKEPTEVREETPTVAKKSTKAERKAKGEKEMAKKSKKQTQAQTPEAEEPEEEEVMEDAVEELEEVGEEETPQPKKARKSKKAKEAKKIEAPGVSKKAPTPPSKGEEVTVKEVAAELNVDPKIVRKKLRSLFPDHEAKERWSWKPGSKELNQVKKKLQQSLSSS